MALTNILGTDTPNQGRVKINELMDLVSGGNVIILATGVPSNGTGEDGTYYLDLDTGNFYEKVAGSWGSPDTKIVLEDAPVGINTQTGTTYTLVLADAGKTVTLSNAAAITLTVPANATAAFPVGTVIVIAQLGAGTVTVAGAGGVTVNSEGGLLDLSGQYATAALLKTATDTWVLSGSLA